MIKAPVVQHLQLNLDSRVQRVDPLDQVNIDHAIIVHLQRSADRVLSDLQPAVQVAPSGVSKKKSMNKAR